MTSTEVESGMVPIAQDSTVNRMAVKEAEPEPSAAFTAIWLGLNVVWYLLVSVQVHRVSFRPSERRREDDV